MTSRGKSAGAALNSSQVQAILIAALVCASLSLLLVFITLRWFLIMRRCFRHRLVLHLIISDTMKAIWYFVFPIVAFTTGSVSNTSNFCQASGFLLAFAIEASDMAILIIALHCTLCNLRSHNTIGDGGLHRYRHWIYPLWLGPPLLAASLAFVNSKEGYVTAATFCYLPKRPFWYRLALSWVPRYVIIGLILAMYIWIYIYVHVKFRGFDNLGATDSSYASEARRRSGLSTGPDTFERRGTDANDGVTPSADLTAFSWQPQYQISGPDDSQISSDLQPWDHMRFIPAKTHRVPVAENTGEDEARAIAARGSGWSGDTQLTPAQRLSQPVNAEAARPTRQDNTTSQPDAVPNGTLSESVETSGGLDEPLKKTRMAIRKQLRYLFIYPLIYIIMWSLPFASHALNYNDYYVQHPIFWLSLISTIMLSLQAGVDSFMFSCSEKPWRRVDASSRFSMPFLRRRSKAFLQRRSLEKASSPSLKPSAPLHPMMVDQHPTWWQAERRRRNDSVWLGTNTISNAPSSITTRTRSKESAEAETRVAITGPEL